MDSVCQKANQTLSFLRRSLKQCNWKVKTSKIYVEPILNYVATVWSPHTLCSINKLESVQKRAARFIIKIARGQVVSHKCFSNVLSLELISYLHTKMQLQIVHKLVELPLPDNIFYLSDLLEEMNINLFCRNPLSILTNIISPLDQ